MYIYSLDYEYKDDKILSLLSPQKIYNKEIPSEIIIGKLANDSSRNTNINTENFIPNPSFINFLHDVIARYGTQVSGLIEQAKKQKKGWVYIIDARCPDPQGRVLPEDIVGAFEVVDGKITSDSYQRNDKYLIFSKKGLFKLQSTLNKYLMQESLELLEKID